MEKEYLVFATTYDIQDAPWSAYNEKTRTAVIADNRIGRHVQNA